MKKSPYLRNSISNDKPGFFPHTKKIIAQQHSMFLLISRQKIEKLLIEVQRKRSKVFQCSYQLHINLLLNTSEARVLSDLGSWSLLVIWHCFKMQDEKGMLWKSMMQILPQEPESLPSKLFWNVEKSSEMVKVSVMANITPAVMLQMFLYVTE